MVTSTALGDEHHRHPAHLLGYVTLLPNDLNQLDKNNFLPNSASPFSSPCKASQNYCFMCSGFMPDTPPALLLRNPFTTVLISDSSVGMASLISNGSILIDMGSPGDSTFHAGPPYLFGLFLHRPLKGEKYY